ncbi:MAG: AIR synthase-related protein, partial [Candidatus Peregrinibacteria bacterium]|nr:AIR synthase-related protein [Candidatus Peregrinibacteria bacterium]
ISAALNEMAGNAGKVFRIYEEKVPMKSAVKTAGNLLGLDPFELANEGKVVCVVLAENTDEVLSVLKKFNSMAAVIGEVVDDSKKGKVLLQTDLGTRVLAVPSGRIVPRIC